MMETKGTPPFKECHYLDLPPIVTILSQFGKTWNGVHKKVVTLLAN